MTATTAMAGTVGAAMALLLVGCLSSPTDHFYELVPRDANAVPHGPFTVLAAVSVTVPAASDRREMVIDAPPGVRILEHQRWAAPLPDQMTAVLGRDLEALRPGLLGSNRTLEAHGARPVGIAVDIVQLRTRLDGPVMLEAQWRIRDGATVEVGSGRFAAAAQGGYAGIAAAISECLGQLAGQLNQALPSG